LKSCLVVVVKLFLLCYFPNAEPQRQQANRLLCIVLTHSCFV
jgi:hypothetical protein